MPESSRTAVRIVLLDPTARVLLFEARDLSAERDEVRFWFTAGGGVAPGESLLEAAARELGEETGLAGVELVGPFHRREVDFLDHGTPRHQVEHYFAARTSTAAVDETGWTDLEKEAVTRWRWWSAAEIERATVPVFPDELAELVRRADHLV